MPRPARRPCAFPRLRPQRRDARDIDRVLEQLSEDVDWPNAWESGRINGHAALRDYWTRQWSAVHPRVDPLDIQELPDERIAVRVRQRVRSLDGDEIANQTVTHVYSFRGGLVARMDLAG